MENDISGVGFDWWTIFCRSAELNGTVNSLLLYVLFIASETIYVIFKIFDRSLLARCADVHSMLNCSIGTTEWIIETRNRENKNSQ